MKMQFKLISPDWKDIPNVKCFTIISESYASNINFKGDSPIAQGSLEKLSDIIGVSTKIHWVDQAHENLVSVFPESIQNGDDAVITNLPAHVCAMKAADCVPIFFSNKLGNEVAITHAGWKGFKRGVITSTVEKMRSPNSELRVWLGPAISRLFYEVDDVVINEFQDNKFKDLVFSLNENGKYYMDLYKLAYLELTSLGISETNISGGDFCTFSDNRIHSVRRDGKTAGRNASVIWISK